MTFSIFSFLLTFLPFLALTSPLATDPIQSQSFKLHSRPLDASLTNLTDLYLEPYHIYPAFNYAVLTPKTSENTGIVGYLNGTEQELENNDGNLLFMGESDLPYGFVVDRGINESYIPLEINAGNGTQGIFIDQGVIKVHDPLSGGFYACNKTLLYGPAIQLFYKIKFIAAPVGCSDVELVVEYLDSAR